MSLTGGVTLLAVSLCWLPAYPFPRVGTSETCAKRGFFHGPSALIHSVQLAAGYLGGKHALAWTVCLAQAVTRCMLPCTTAVAPGINR